MSRNGSLRLFQLAGIDVYVHWSWLLVAFFQVQYRRQLLEYAYDQPSWYWIEYLSLFAIVLTHEFGHALACRQVGGTANYIVLWPLGGVAYVNPPPRPAAVLWSIAAGPLVNVLLIPITVGFCLLSKAFAWGTVYPDLSRFIVQITIINAGLLLFNMMPVYPLDGGQILQALLWFVVGRARSLMVVSIIGLVMGGCGLILALLSREWWLSILAAFVVFRAISGLQQSRLLERILSGPRHKEAVCPSCRVSPLVGNYWTCDECGTRFDTFACHGQCPGCGQLFRMTKCPECYKQNPIGQWLTPATPPVENPHRLPE